MTILLEIVWVLNALGYPALGTINSYAEDLYKIR